MVRRSKLVKVIRNKLTAAQTKMERHTLNTTYPDGQHVWLMEMTNVVDEIS